MIWPQSPGLLQKNSRDLNHSNTKKHIASLYFASGFFNIFQTTVFSTIPLKHGSSHRAVQIMWTRQLRWDCFGQNDTVSFKASTSSFCDPSCHHQWCRGWFEENQKTWLPLLLDFILVQIWTGVPLSENKNQCSTESIQVYHVFCDLQH